MSTKTYYFSAATLSWIDPITGLPEVDKAGEPSSTLNFDQITKAHNCRFSNLLMCSIVVQDGRIVSRAADSSSGLYMRPSYKGTPPQSYKVRRDFDTWDDRQAIFVQTVGCRTMAPELIGAFVGGLAGGTILSGGRPNFSGWSATIGREVAEFAKTFPPIWTTLRVRMFATGIATAELVAHSLFPSLSYYESLGAGNASLSKPLTWVRNGESYNAVTQLESWKKTGWGHGNPWVVENPGKIRNDRIR